MNASQSTCTSIRLERVTRRRSVVAGQLLQLLQGLATEWSSAVLDRLGVVHLIEGNVIEVHEAQE